MERKTTIRLQLDINIQKMLHQHYRTYLSLTQTTRQVFGTDYRREA